MLRVLHYLALIAFIAAATTYVAPKLRRLVKGGNYDLLLTIFTGVLAIVAIIQIYYLHSADSIAAEASHAAQRSADIAGDTLAITQRPWISAKAEVGAGGLVFDTTGAHLDVVYVLKNTGNTPALNVQIVGAPRIDVDTDGKLVELSKICTEAASRPPDQKDWGTTIFPGETAAITITYGFATTELLDRTVNKHHGFIAPVLIGCIDYLFAFGERVHHQTKFVFDVDYPLPNGGSRVIRVSNGNRAAKELRLLPSEEAGSFEAD